ncbi:MAG: hypothetical protein NC180_00630 [Muribaculaceae bacterium]|nr:hypothetical protein [Roseburia sp.]MCM1430921.1 hypothetical protein [Muribaculaceae bacterium]MCM1491718.1 hypothetical protein [Muribaculaceae bacterium]
MVITHNLQAVNAQRQYKRISLDKKKAAEKLSSGFRINRAADDAAGLSISEKMRKQIRGLDRGTENMQDGVSWLQIGDGAMGEVQAILQRMNELSVYGANGTLSRSDREAIDAEVQHLKTEIDRINETAEFNDIRIFSRDNQAPNDIGDFIIEDLDRAPMDLKIFNATYDDATGDVTYGGIVFNDSRIPWTEIDSNMVYTDGTQQKFHEGTWVYLDSQNRMLTISAREGDEVPRITRSFDISASSVGLQIDGEEVPWQEIKNKSGEAITDSAYINGAWIASYHGAEITFEVKNAYQGLPGLIEAINSAHDEKKINVYATYAGSSDVQAVEADIGGLRVRLSNPAAQMAAAGKSFVLRADTDGMWLQDGDGNDITGSKKLWSDMGIHSWDHGTDINDSIKYTYSDSDGVNDTKISFDFRLSDITSIDSVIDGLDGVEITHESVVSHYQTTADNTNNFPNVTDVRLAYENTKITLQDEIDLGRDFDLRTQTFAPGMNYQSANSSVSLTYTNNGNDVIQYTGSASSVLSEMERNLINYENSVIQSKILQALAGIDGLDLGPKDLRDLLGADKVSAAGKMTDRVTVTSAMEHTELLNNNVEKSFPCGMIDFSGLGQDYSIWELIGSGFNSNCGTCSKHYSFKFVYDTDGDKQVEGFRYNASARSASSSNNPELEISVSSLVEKGVTTGADLASALVKIIDTANFDNHFQQYAADGNKFYVHETREENGWSRAAMFYTTPYNTDNKKQYFLNLTSPAGNGSQRLTYQYDHTDYENQIQVEMVKNNTSGQYVKNAVGSYVEYKPADHAGMDRYDVHIIYANDGNGNANSTQTETKTIKVGGENITVITSGSPQLARETYADRAVSEMVGASAVSLNATDYTSAVRVGDENPNVAVDSIFRAYSAMPLPPTRWDSIKWEDSIQIQKSGDVPNRLTIPRFSVNSAVLGLGRANCLTEGDSRNTIDMVNWALANVSAKRSLYGSLQNALEHAIRSNENTEENTQAAESRIRDTDMAEEMVSLFKNNILEQAGQSMLAQTNQQAQAVLNLLQ